MTLFRTLVVLAIALAVLLGVVALRAETTRLQYLTSKLDQEAEQALEQLRQHELELARLRNPMIIRERARALVWPGTEGAPPAAQLAERPAGAKAGEKSAPRSSDSAAARKAAANKPAEPKASGGGKSTAGGNSKPAAVAGKAKPAGRDARDNAGTKPANGKATRQRP